MAAGVKGGLLNDTLGVDRLQLWQQLLHSRQELLGDAPAPVAAGAGVVLDDLQARLHGLATSFSTVGLLLTTDTQIINSHDS